ncbi:BZ3500_MvSof-1268-A1-R1_Chr2-2g05106 [Microbotryum saponariae]|uniref:BZ3500_MvSof-1268-A1-R1_Chr2-2g05106 protein n=1 Tax=Microbotryum saponariae TaxID=289078 RepID=A0A2X0L2Y9_9BASI|nr:BZ3500_MvSof-1268-A1-R1_Chr2-2g05106 [Microbotryum saponariae]SDA00924.1 BZ3501_MvSof-1269-A2-R1_Chr2-2g04780 [Microbotryum saponariae]
MSTTDYSAYTQSVIDSIGKNASPRVKEAFPIMLKHLHAAIIETGLTTEEWLGICNLLIEAGKVSDDKRNEMVLVTDVLGVESLVDMLEHDKYAKAGVDATPSAILGPFYRHGVTPQPMGTSIIREKEPGAPFAHLFGTVFGCDGKPLKGAIVDIWHDAPDGYYDAQSPDKAEYHCRGRFETGEDGKYSTIALVPTPYPVPFDHTAGKVLTMMDRHAYRPAHIHFYVSAPGHKTLVTQVFDRNSKYLDDDAVFAVKDSLVVDFVPVCHPLPNGGEFDETPKLELKYDITLASNKLE